MKRLSFSGFLKYWPSGKRSRLLIEQFNGQALSSGFPQADLCQHIPRVQAEPGGAGDQPRGLDGHAGRDGEAGGDGGEEDLRGGIQDGTQ